MSESTVRLCFLIIGLLIAVCGFGAALMWHGLLPLLVGVVGLLVAASVFEIEWP